MASEPSWRDLVLAVGPFEEPNAALALAAHRGGARGVVDLGRDRAAALSALARLSRNAPDVGLGVRVPDGCPVTPDELPDQVGMVVLGPEAPWRVGEVRGRRVLVEVLSAEDAVAALADGADGLVARGAEDGGRCGDLTTFVLLQRLLGAMEPDGTGRADDAEPGWRRVPVWARGGIGLHTAAAAVAGGAAGVVLDTQLALLAEAEADDGVAAALRAADGGETVVVDGRRVVRRKAVPPAGRAVGGRAVGRGGADEAGGRGVGGAGGGPGASVTAGDGPSAAGRDAALPAGREAALPVGQDAALAARFAERYGTTGRTVQAVRAAIRDHLAAAVDSAAAAQDPAGRPRVVQGPMTRVSDQAEFAGAVAEAGGLPFLALSLLSGPDTRALLRETVRGRWRNGRRNCSASGA